MALAAIGGFLLVLFVSVIVVLRRSHREEEELEISAETGDLELLVETEEDAKMVLEKAKAGDDFAELAKTYSTGPSGPSGGDLGYFGKGQMVPEFETAAFALNAGEVSGIVQTQFGQAFKISNFGREFCKLIIIKI